MASLLGNAAVFQEDNAVAKPGGGQPVGDKEGGFPLGHFTVLEVDFAFGDGIQGGGGLVQHQYGAVSVEGS